MNNTSFSDDRFSDQSVRTSRNFERNIKNTENRDFTKNQHFFHENPNEPKNSDLTEQISRKQQKTSPHRTKIQTNGGKREITEQNLDEQRAMVAPAHNHTENYKNLQELTLWMGTGFTRSHGGLLMIMPVDQNAGALPRQTCIDVCAALASVLHRDPPQEPAKEQNGAAAADRTPTSKSVTEPPNTKSNT